MNRITLALLGAALILALSACGTTEPEPRIVVREVQVPVPVPCAARAGPDPAFADSDDALRSVAGQVFEQVKLLLAGREQRDARIGELKAVNTACSTPPP